VVFSVKEHPVNWPLSAGEIGQTIEGSVNIPIGVLVTVTVVAVKKNPLPDIVPEVPIGPEVGVRVILGPVTVKVAASESPVGVPVSITV